MPFVPLWLHLSHSEADSILLEADHNVDADLISGLALDAESVSISSSTTSGGRRPGARQILGLAIPGMRASSRGASLENNFMEEIPEQLRTPKVPQVSLEVSSLLVVCLYFRNLPCV